MQSEEKRGEEEKLTGPQINVKCNKVSVMTLAEVEENNAEKNLKICSKNQWQDASQI